MICWVCGHDRKQHSTNVLPELYKGEHWCRKCFELNAAGKYRKSWHTFESNLDYIERLAEERHLV
jgi:hypothetical protein